MRDALPTAFVVVVVVVAGAVDVLCVCVSFAASVVVVVVVTPPAAGEGNFPGSDFLLDGKQRKMTKFEQALPNGWDLAVRLGASAARVRVFVPV